MKPSKTIRFKSLLHWGILFLLLISTNAFAQTAKVNGKVLSQNSAAPVGGATVTVKNTSRSTIADEAGRFTIDASADDVLVITSVGYTPLEVKVGSGPRIMV